MRIRAFAESDVGLCRQRNEDSFLVDDTKKLYAVADGVGGQPAGDVASRLVTESLSAYLEETSPAPTDPLAILKSAISRLNTSLQNEASKRTECRGMATTVVSLWYRSSSAHVVNVGDSRAYMVRDGKLEQISEEHTVAAEQNMSDEMDVSSGHKMTHVLSRGLGIEQEVLPYAVSIPVQIGDRILLCSDGLSDLVSNEVICSVVSTARTPKEACRVLVDLAMRNGGRDNITVLPVFFDGNDSILDKIKNLFCGRS